MNGDDGLDRSRGPDPRRPRRSCRPLWLGGLPEPERAPGPGGDDGPVHDPATCDECGPGLGGAGFDGFDGPDFNGFEGSDPLLPGGEAGPDLGEIVVILLVSTLAGLRDRLERDGFASAAGLVHDLVEVADDYVTRFQCEP